MDITNLNIGDWVKVLGREGVHQTASVNEEFDYATVIMNGQSKVVLAKYITLARPREGKGKADNLSDLKKQMAAIDRRLELICEDMNALDIKLNEALRQ